MAFGFMKEHFPRRRLCEMTSTLALSLSFLSLSHPDLCTASGGTSSCKQACNDLRGKLPAEAFPVTDGAYYWALQASEITPTCFVQPRMASHVSIVVKTAISYQCPFAIRGGGHSDVSGASNSPGGITLDLGAMDTIDVTEGGTLARLGPGLSWGDVYKVLDLQNITVVGGRESSVGVAGLILGGGISYFSGLHGFACDNVKNFEVVLANGDTVQANVDSDYADLYHALRGGGNNFGVVTRFDLVAYPQGLMHGGLIIWSDNPKTESGLIEAFTKFSHSASSDPRASMFTSFSYSPITDSFIWAAGLTYSEPNTAPAIFSPFYTSALNSSKPLSTERTATLNSLAEELDKTQPAGFREQFHTASFTVNGKLQAQIVNFFREEVSKVHGLGLHNSTGFSPVMAFQPLTLPFLQKQAQRGRNVLGLAAKEAPLMVFSMAWPWISPEDDAAVIGGMQNIINRSVEVAKKMGLHNDFIYMNYAPFGSQPIKTYGTSNREFMEKVSQKYDPAGVFQKLVPGGFKLM